MNDAFNELMKTQGKLLEERKKTIKIGPNIFHIDHIGEVTSDDLQEIESRLKTVGLELSSYNKSGILRASLDDFTLTSFIVISQPIIIELLKSTATNTVWEVVKFCTVSLWEKYWSKKTAASNKNQTFGIQVKLGKNTVLNFELKGEVEKATIDSSLDKILDFLDKQQLKESYQFPDYVYYSESKGEWIKIDVMEEIKRKVNKQKTTKKNRD